MSVRVSLRGMLMLIRVDTLHRVHIVGFLAADMIPLRRVHKTRLNVINFLTSMSQCYGDTLSHGVLIDRPPR